MRIKENLVAAVIMNVTRNLDDLERRNFKRFCEHVVSEQKPTSEEDE